MVTPFSCEKTSYPHAPGFAGTTIIHQNRHTDNYPKAPGIELNQGNKKLLMKGRSMELLYLACFRPKRLYEFPSIGQPIQRFLQVTSLANGVSGNSFSGNAPLNYY